MQNDTEVPTRNDLTIASYAALAHATNRLKKYTNTPLDLPMLGLFGEAGSLLSAVKKRSRDSLPTDQYYSTVEEEVGDFLWYFSSVCHAADVNLEQVVHGAAKEAVRRAEGLRFSDVEKQFSRKIRPPIERLIAQLIALSGDVGKFANWHAHSRTAHTPETVQGHLVPIMRGLIRASSAAGITVQDAAVRNLLKIEDRWPKSRKSYPDLPDEYHPEITEKLPRKLTIQIEQRTRRGKNYVFQTCNGLNIGDPLTDNIGDEDFYRFHDVFHYAYAAILGWSPVTRSLFRLKRKSDLKLDENEDGARATLIEEGLSAMVFNYAKEFRYFEGINRGDLSFDLLKTVREFVRGYEVERTPLWLWEEAILEGYKCFRVLRVERSGVITLDLVKRQIKISKVAK